ncbi:HD domain-containing protein [Desulfosporosinus sp. FKA]|uniref:HD domain-containing protein n=1 Tax=Desulfosporosinus sp. FKA TaxID=1969834 RepID=UPI000B4A06DE|nr:HD domain-containing protein [Desulfosporosinus sp. FKA]
MNELTLENLNSWFDHYSQGFLSGNPEINRNIQFKIDHTDRVRENIIAIAHSLDLSANNLRIAELIGLLHDVGRYEQFIKYGTYRDDISEDHAELGLKVLADNQLLNDLSDEEKNIVETAIRCHNKYSLPQELSTDSLMFCKLIRDADKLDIFKQIINEIESLSERSESSPEVIESILKGKGVSYSGVKSTIDLILMRMSWVLDINYGLTLRKIRDMKYLERMVDKLPKTEDIRNVYDYLNTYLERRRLGERVK